MIAAVVPAAGLGSRMGRPKLALPVGGVPLIARVVAALFDGGVERVVVVAPPAGAPGGSEVVEAATAQGAEVLIPIDPPVDMRASVELGLARLAEGPAPQAILLAPGDSPAIHFSLVARLLGASADAPGRIIVPRHEGRRGHPILIPRELVGAIVRLPPGLGVNALLDRYSGAVDFLDTDDPGVLADLDTPEDYRLWSTG